MDNNVEDAPKADGDKIVNKVENAYGKADNLVKKSKFGSFLEGFSKVSDWLSSGKIFRIALGVVVYGGGAIAAIKIFILWCKLFKLLEDINFLNGLALIITLILTLPCIVLAFAHWFRQGVHVLPKNDSEITLLPGMTRMFLILSESFLIFTVLVSVVLLITTLLSPEMGEVCVSGLTMGACIPEETTRWKVWCAVFKAPLFGIAVLIITRFTVELVTILLQILANLEDIRRK